VDGSRHRHRDGAYCACCYEAAYVACWLDSDLLSLPCRGPLSGGKQTFGGASTGLQPRLRR
jgi:hypothetical protein